jgi:aspartate ammonia-lyase
MRIEKDFIGKVEIPSDVLYGIHSCRAKQNFDNETIFPKEWYCAMGLVKLACFNTYKKLKINAIENKLENKIPLIEDDIIETLCFTANEIANGKHFEHFIVPAIQGGAGTSINMNINEIIANNSLIKLGKKPGDYDFIDPIEHANIFQSTNDTVGTALKIAVMYLLQTLEEKINLTRTKFEELEKKYRHCLRIGYTQMQEAVPTTFGKMFSAYNDALSRDWWRTSKCFERIKVVNIGGGAIGTGLAIPRFFIMEVINELQRITNLPIARGENLVDTTQNLDAFVEIHSTIKSHAVNLEKIANDLRLLASDISHKTIELPAVQAGSSIMPGKVNPVISEYIIGICHQIYANDILISNLCAQGLLELNAYLPIIGKSIIESIKLLISANISLSEKVLNGLKINENNSLQLLYKSPSITTALIPYIGYHKATEIAIYMKDKNINIFEANKELNFIEEEQLLKILNSSSLNQLGFSLREI